MVVPVMNESPPCTHSPTYSQAGNLSFRLCHSVYWVSSLLPPEQFARSVVLTSLAVVCTLRHRERGGARIRVD